MEWCLKEGRVLANGEFINLNATGTVVKDRLLACYGARDVTNCFIHTIFFLIGWSEND